MGHNCNQNHCGQSSRESLINALVQEASKLKTVPTVSSNEIQENSYEQSKQQFKQAISECVLAGIPTETLIQITQAAVAQQPVEFQSKIVEKVQKYISKGSKEPIEETAPAATPTKSSDELANNFSQSVTAFASGYINKKANKKDKNKDSKKDKKDKCKDSEKEKCKEQKHVPEIEIL